MNRLLYIAGAGRSGSTLLARVLQAAGAAVVSPGELFYVWQEGFFEDRVCECGKHFSACDFWAEVVRRSGVGGATTASEVIALQADVARTRHVPRLALTRNTTWVTTRHPRYVEILGSLYSSLFEVTGARVVVDGSKSPSYACVLKAIPHLEVFVVHLVRDPRGVAWSWTKKRVNPSSGRPFGRMSYVKSAALWSAWNSATTTLHGPRSSPGRYLRMRYEDFIDDPVSSLSRVLSFVDEPAVDLPIPGGDGVPALPMTRRHSIGGNPAKFVDGLIRFKTDTTWREEMPRLGRSVVTALTWPLLMKYGYPLGVSS